LTVALWVVARGGQVMNVRRGEKMFGCLVHKLLSLVSDELKRQSETANPSIENATVNASLLGSTSLTYLVNTLVMHEINVL
jgi:hypothetical protein